MSCPRVLCIQFPSVHTLPGGRDQKGSKRQHSTVGQKASNSALRHTLDSSACRWGDEGSVSPESRWIRPEGRVTDISSSGLICF